MSSKPSRAAKSQVTVKLETMEMEVFAESGEESCSGYDEEEETKSTIGKKRGRQKKDAGTLSKKTKTKKTTYEPIFNDVDPTKTYSPSSPELIQDLITMVLEGVTIEMRELLSKKYGVDKGLIRNQWNNTTKGRILKALEAEFSKGKKSE